MRDEILLFGAKLLALGNRVDDMKNRKNPWTIGPHGDDHIPNSCKHQLNLATSDALEDNKELSLEMTELQNHLTAGKDNYQQLPNSSSHRVIKLEIKNSE